MFFLLTLLTLVAYTLVSYLWAESIGGLAFSLSIIALLTTFVYYKINESLRYNIGEIILANIGFLIGVVFWSFQYEITFGGIAWSIASIVVYCLCLKTTISKNIGHVFLLVFLAIKIALLFCFICILLGLAYGNTVLAISFAIVIMLLFGCINVYYVF